MTNALNGAMHARLENVTAASKVWNNSRTQLCFLSMMASRNLFIKGLLTPISGVNIIAQFASLSQQNTLAEI